MSEPSAALYFIMKNEDNHGIDVEDATEMYVQYFLLQLISLRTASQDDSIRISLVKHNPFDDEGDGLPAFTSAISDLYPELVSPVSTNGSLQDVLYTRLPKKVEDEASMLAAAVMTREFYGMQEHLVGGIPRELLLCFNGMMSSSLGDVNNAACNTLVNMMRAELN
jgi:hypothetical protein